MEKWTHLEKSPRLPAGVKLAVWLALALSVASCLPPASWPPAPGYRPPPQAYPQPQQPLPGIYFMGEVETEVLRGANEERRRCGLPPLAGDQALAGAARRHSGDMLARGFFSHTTPDGVSAAQRLPRGYGQVLRQSGENIWMGSGQNPGDSRRLAGKIMATLMASPGHRQNILDPHYSHLGVGVAAWGQEVRATQVFGQLTRRRLLRGSGPSIVSPRKSADFNYLPEYLQISLLKTRNLELFVLDIRPGIYIFMVVSRL